MFRNFYQPNKIGSRMPYNMLLHYDYKSIGVRTFISDIALISHSLPLTESDWWVNKEV